MMKHSNIGLLDFFTGEMKSALVEFCKLVNQANADVIVLMAHKAVLLYNILVAQGYIVCNKQTIVVTSFALDFDSSYVNDKRILILDDIIISGTSIASIVNKLLKLGARQEDIEIIAVATDSTYLGMCFDLPNEQEAMHYGKELDESLCIELSATISKAFAYYGIPYDVDFPSYEDIFINRDYLHSLFNPLFWEAINVSNINHTNNAVAVHTLFPTPVINKKLWDEIGADLSECIKTKIRLFITDYPDGTIVASVVPMCLFSEIKREDIDVLFHRLFLEERTMSWLPSLTYVAKIRYIEFHLSHILFTVFRRHTVINCKSMFTREYAIQLFGPKTGDLIHNHLENYQTHSFGSELIKFRCLNIADSIAIKDQENINKCENDPLYKSRCEEGKQWKESDNYQIGCWLNHFIFNPFLWWRDSKEIPVRKKLKKQKLHYVKDYKKIEEYCYRLKHGFSFSALDELLSRQVPEIDRVERIRAISLFLDRAIDEGIVVPTIHSGENDQYVCRAYRHGEDLPFGIADQYRFVSFIKYFGEIVQFGHMLTIEEKEKMGTADWNEAIPIISEIAFEKICVLFYQLGLKKGNIFNRFLGFDNTDIIHGFLSVHGSVMGYTAADADIHLWSTRKTDGDEYITWLSKWLIEKGLVTTGEVLNESNSKHLKDSERILHLKNMIDYLKRNERGTISTNIDKRIRSLAEIIAKWYCGMAKAEQKIEFRDNASALTSCANKYVFASAIATENVYFSLFWQNQAHWALDKPSDSFTIVGRLMNNEKNRDNVEKITSALHSGRDKVTWRKNNAARTIINQVSNKYLDSTESDQWESSWNDIDEYQPKPKSDDMLAQYTNEAVGFLYFFSACFELLRDHDFWTNQPLSESAKTAYASFKEMYNAQVANNTHFACDWFALLDNLISNNTLNVDNRAAELLTIVDDALNDSKTCCENIEKEIWQSDPTYTVRYTSVLVVEMEPISADPSSCDSILTELWTALDEDEKKTELNIVRMPQLEEKRKTYGIFFGIAKSHTPDQVASPNENEVVNTNGTYLVGKFQDLLTLSAGKLHSIRSILIPRIQYQAYFKHNLQKNIKRHTGEFFDQQIKPFIDYYANDTKVQLLLGLKSFASESFWDDIKKHFDTISKIAIPGGNKLKYSKCLIAKGKPYIECHSDDIVARMIYSQLILEKSDGVQRKMVGLGLLLRTQHGVVCLTCNHIVEALKENETIYAISACDNDIQFQLEPLTTISKYKSKNEVLPAEKEVCLLKPKWKFDIPYEIKSLTTCEDWADVPAVNTHCRCYRKSTNEMEWTKSGTVAHRINKNYYQIRDLQNEMDEGCSGGVFLSTDGDSQQLLGIHDGRFGEDLRSVRMIPWSEIKSVLNNLEV